MSVDEKFVDINKFPCYNPIHRKTIDEVGTSDKGGGSMKIELKTLNQIKKELSKIDWDFWLRVGTFLAAVWNALK